MTFPANTFPARSICTYGQADLDAIVDELNGRPRQTLGFPTPSDPLEHVLR